MLWISPEKVNQFVKGNMLGQQSETEGVELQLSLWDWREFCLVIANAPTGYKQGHRQYSDKNEYVF